MTEDRIGKPGTFEWHSTQRVITLGGIKRNALLQNFPNPFNPETWIPYRFENENTVTINIYNHAGTLVRTLPFGHETRRRLRFTGKCGLLGWAECHW